MRQLRGLYRLAQPRGEILVKADLLIHGGAILAPVNQLPLLQTGKARGGLAQHEALATASGRILAVGKLADLEALISPNTKRFNLEGRTLLPGFNDAHVHVWKVGQLRTTMLDLRGVTSLTELYAKVSERAKALNPGEWLWGRGWNEAKLAEQTMPSKQALDQASPQNPVLLTRTCAHIHAVNSRALQIAKVDRHTHVPGGEIDFDKGILFETAYGLVFNAMPAPTQADYQRWILAGLAYLKSLGITSATDPAVDPALYAAYRSLDKAGRLPIRVNLLYIRRPDGGTKTFPLPEKYRSDFLRCDSVKFFSDGGLSGATAAISQSYRNTEGPSRGVLRFETEELYQLALEAHSNGFRIGTHSIGDRALDQVLSVYQRLYQTKPSTIRHRIEHFGLPGENHLALMKQMNTIAVPQPIFLHELRENFRRYLPEDFICRCYNLKALFDAGLTVAFSSDGPVVHEVSPVEGIKAAINEPMCKGNGVSLDQALWAYTQGGAIAQGDQGNRGSIASGRWADFTILNGFFEDLDSVGIYQTLVAGA